MELNALWIEIIHSGIDEIETWILLKKNNDQI
jgi:hypothetical protein